MKNFLFFGMASFPLLCNTIQPGRPANIAFDSRLVLIAASDSQDLVGSWEGGAGDGGGAYIVELELHADGTYKKTLTAKTNNPDGSHSGYGGSHTGTWKSKGSIVYLSGDGNWPPYSHDLSKFRKVR